MPLSHSEQPPEPVAIVGIGLRFPGGSGSPDEFDAFLAEGRSGIGPIPRDRWDVDAFTPEGPDDKGKIIASGGGFLDRIDLFDAGFFNISPKEARYMDPQQRLLLETAWQALEHAGIDPAPLRRGNGGVYIGASSIDYALELDALPYEELDGHLASGITMFPLSGRLSYFLGWRGPSMSVDTACSSSLVALHLAVQALRGGETDLALCGGVNALHHPRIPVMFSNAQMLAPDGHCKTFDEAADGYARAEGCGVVVLKRLSDAERDGDRVLALVRGTAVGQDGDSAGLTVPNGPAQEKVIRSALAAAHLGPEDISYVEAHGTGTPLGDPIEFGAIGDVFVDTRTKDDPVLVGSVKTNLGHMEPASGIVGVIKTVLQLRAETVYPHVGLKNPSGRIPWDLYPLRVPTEPEPWKAEVRRAVVNSFGFAGTIGAVVLEQAPRTPAAPTDDAADTGIGAHTEKGAAPLFTLSAKNAAALAELATSYRALLDEHPELTVEAVAHSANTTRTHHPYRVAAPVADRAALARLLDRAAGAEHEGPSGIRKTAFMFTGQGSQYAGMGAALYAELPVFRDRVDACDELFAPHLGRSVRELLLGTADDPGAIDRTEFTQPALFTLEYALAQQWLAWGVRPNVLIGHSIGEVVAAAVAGLFDLPDAVTLVAARARLMQAVRAEGGMAAVAAPVEEVAPLLEGRADLAVAGINAPDQTVVSGATAALDEVVGILTERGVRVDRLTVSHAFHSPLMAEVYDAFRAALDGITFREPTIGLVSNVTGRLARFREIGTPDYWVRHIGEPVRFLDGIRAVARRGRHALIEIGPQAGLTALARRGVTVEDHLWLASLRRRDTTTATTLTALADYYAAGLPVSWTGYHAGRPVPARVDLPTYAFQRKRYWLPTATPRRTAANGAARHPLLGAEERFASGVREFTAEFTPEELGALADLTEGGRTVLPAGAFVDLLFALQDAVRGHTRSAVRDLELHAPLELAPETVTVLTSRWRPRPDGGAEVQVFTVVGGEENIHATARVASDGEPAVPAPELLELDAQLPSGEQHIDDRDIYTDLASVGRPQGDRMRLLRGVARHDGGLVTGELTGRDASAVEHVPADLLEAAAQALVVLDPEGPVFVPRAVASVRHFRKPRGERLRVLARVREEQDRRLADVLLLENGDPVAELLGVRLTRPDNRTGRRRFLHRPEWVRRALPATGNPGPARHVVLLDRTPARAAALAGEPGLKVTWLADPAGLKDALADPTVTDVCRIWRTGTDPMSVDRLRAECEQNYREILAVVGALDAAGLSVPPRLWLVTQGAQALPGDPAGDGGHLAAATLWGFGRVLLTEYPQIRATLLDLAPGSELTPLPDEWRTAPAGEFQIAHRPGRRYVRRLLAGDEPLPWTGEFELRAAESGDLSDLALAPAETHAPGTGEVRVRVRLVGLTAEDAREALDTSRAERAESERAESAESAGADSAAPASAGVGSPGRPAASGAPEREPYAPDGTAPRGSADDELPPLLGRSAHGTVLTAAPGTGFAPGDEVLVRHDGTFRSTLTVPAASVVHAPLPEPGDGARHFALDETGEALRTTLTGPAVPAWVALPDDPAAARPAPADRTPDRLRPDRTYLVTGGLGGLGLATARKLAGLGARHLTLVSRSGRPAPEAADLLTELSTTTETDIVRADLGSPEDVARLVRHLQDGPRPLGGIVHAAGGSYEDRLISELTWEDIEGQLAAKAYGGWLLHEATEHAFPDLEFFVVYSSVSSVLGGFVAQGHYAAGNAALDGLADWRARRGLPGLALNWSSWSRVGMSARMDDVLIGELERGGVHLFSPTRALNTLAALWDRSGGQRVVGDFDWDRYMAGRVTGDLFLDRLARQAPEDDGGLDLAALTALPPAERAAAVTAVVRDRVAAVLHLEEGDELDPHTEFVSLGLDSLMAQQVKSGLEQAFRLPLPASLTHDHPTVRRLAGFLGERLGPC
ncbi:SDR family NAD(P)-dependent oxidoreductase [Streptomyces sp. J2-1]|uniref:type I polyketide synthase n=1 Tax=Streptomyces corallincola TaxID=2851888 RepID=UPI001C38BC8C|nr:type I polyketide synthase [Streptomyces corallincola]MBV2355206.1 SDR family NAD(P)-dependent oxidoreductase [Streptomyces corallincola]